MSVTFYPTRLIDNAWHPLFIEDEEAYLDNSVNLCNRNAALVLRTLGYDASECCGTLDPADLISRILLHTALDEETPSFPTIQEGHMIEVGLEPHYISRQFERLLVVAETARIADCEVGYA